MKTLFIESINDFIKINVEEEKAQTEKYYYEVVIRDGVTAIPKEAFKECVLLTRVIIPDSVREIGDNAFEHCGIENIDIPYSVTKLGWGAFKNCHWLKYVSLVAKIDKIPGECFAGAAIETIAIPDSVVEIEPCAFECTQIKYFTIPDSVTRVWYKAFNKCSLLKAIKLSKNMTTIPFQCFENCHRLKRIEIPDSVVEIDAAFRYCRSLSEITIPKGVKEIAYGAFSGTCIFPTSVPTRFRNEKTFAKGDLRTFKIIND